MSSPTSKKQNPKKERPKKNEKRAEARSSYSGPYPVLSLLPGRENRLRDGHLWVFKNEIKSPPKGLSLPPGGIVDLVNAKGRFVARGTHNALPQIAFRALTFDRREMIDNTWIDRRIQAAIERRARGGIFRKNDPRRLIFSEGDFLPGLVVDLYGGVAIVQILTAGMERFREAITNSLASRPEITGIHERSDVTVRRHEGLNEREGVLWGAVPDEIKLSVDGLTIPVPLKSGQKTGLYLDQRFNRQAAASYAKGARVMDVFANTGLFGLYALKAGAASVTAVEISKEMAAVCRAGAKENFPQADYTVIADNAFDVLRKQSDDGEEYDLIVLDPPAFTKSASAVESALRGYKEINLRAIKMLPVGGILVSCTCSYHVSETAYIDVIRQAAQDAHRRLAIREIRGQSPDHPILLGVPETRYLTCVILERIT